MRLTIQRKLNSSGSLALVLAAVLLGQKIQATPVTTVFGTYPSWNGTSDIQAFGSPGGAGTSTYGETVVIPAGISELNDFTFYIESLGGADLYMQGVVLNWGGSLLGGAGNGHGVGAPLYLSPTFNESFTSTFVPVTVNIPGGVAVVPGQSYFFGLTLSGSNNAARSTGITQWGDTQRQHVANDGGGGFVFFNNGSNLPELTNGAVWDNFTDYGDLAFDVNGTTANIPQTPDGGYTICLLGLALGLLVFARRRVTI